VSGYYDVTGVDPLAPSGTFANTLNGIFAGHDNGDYSVTRGGSVTWEVPIKPSLLLRLSGRVERQNSSGRNAQSAVNDFLGGSGVFPPNPPVEEGTFGGGSLDLSGGRQIQWQVTADVLGGNGPAVGRVYGGVNREWGSAPKLSARFQAGIGTDPGLPQTLFRLGGLNTVRGFEYGTRRGSAFWSGQLDVALLSGRVRPLLFLDLGQTSRLSDLSSSPALVGAGAGVAILRGLIRFDLSRPVSPDVGGKLRFDLIVRGLR
jgi:outer membrane protein assembly factor BamA